MNNCNQSKVNVLWFLYKDPMNCCILESIKYSMIKFEFLTSNEFLIAFYRKTVAEKYF